MTLAAKAIPSASKFSLLKPLLPPKRTLSVRSLPSCTLQWQQGVLFASSPQPETRSDSDPAEISQALPNCLHHPLVRSICLDPKLGETELRGWAELGRFAGKPTFLHLPPILELPPKRSPHRWLLKRIFDWIVAALLLLVLGPVMLAIALLIRLDSPGRIFFQQWRIGAGGKLFRIVKFRTMTQGAEKMHHQVMGKQEGLHKKPNDPRITPLGKWLRKSSLDELPQLFNVLRGEMSLVGPRPWALYDALRIARSGQQRLNALPGITGAWQVEGRSNLRDLDAVNQYDLRYLETWSLGQDLKILLRTIPKVLSGFGAY